MTIAELSDVITALAAIAGASAAITGAVISYRNNRKITATADHIVKLEKQTDGMKDDLVAEVRKNARANGVAQGREEKS